MIHNKNKALDDLYNYRPKQPIAKNFKTKEAQDYLISKPIPINLPEPPPIAKNIVIQKPTPVIIPDAKEPM